MLNCSIAITKAMRFSNRIPLVWQKSRQAQGFR